MVKKYLVVGLGKSGIAAVDYLLQLKHEVWVTDEKGLPHSLQDWPISFLTAEACLGILTTFDEIVVSPGVDLNIPLLVAAREKNMAVIGDVECFARVAQAPIIAITGTNGKGTVVSLVAHILKHGGYHVAVGGNIGTPVLTLLKEAVPDVYVLELSSFQLESTFSLQPEVAAILNITPDHLDRHVTMDQYVKAKQRIYHRATYAVVNAEDPLTLPSADFSGKTFLCHMTKCCSGFAFSDGHITYHHESLLPVSELKIKGQHNIFNSLLALTVSHLFNVPIEAMTQALTTFTGLPHRCEWVGCINDVPWFNDSKATNMGAALAALQGLGASLDGKIIWLAGGQSKGVDFTPLRQPVEDYVAYGILLGEDRERLEEALRGTVPLIIVDSLEEAMELAKDLARPGDAVLLSPACASFDMFSNYEHRGDVFSAWVHQQQE